MPLVVVLVAVAAVVGSVQMASAQLLGDPPGNSSTTTTTTTPPPTSAPSGPADRSQPASTPAGNLDAGDGGTPATESRQVPAEAQAIIDAVPRSGPNSSQALFEAVSALTDLGLSQQEAIRVGFGRFPVAGVATYSHDWLFPRWGPGFRFHLGTDVFAPYGTPLRAPVDGVATTSNNDLGGLTVKVHMPDGAYFYFAHLSALPDTFVDGMTVRTGDIVGFIGDSGNARGGSPHLHLGVYNGAGEATDPKPLLDQMLADAMAALPGIVADVRAQRGAAIEEVHPDAPPRGLLALTLLRPLLEANDVGGQNTAVLYQTVGNPASGGLSLAEDQALQMASSIDWDAAALRQEARRQISQLTRDALGVAFAVSDG